MMNGLDVNGECREDYDVRALYEMPAPWEDDEPAAHAPSEYVQWCREERIRRRLRDLNELQDLWREETLTRQRERAPILRGRFHRDPHRDDRRQERAAKRMTQEYAEKGGLAALPVDWSTR